MAKISLAKEHGRKTNTSKIKGKRVREKFNKTQNLKIMGSTGACGIIVRREEFFFSRLISITFFPIKERNKGFPACQWSLQAAHVVFWQGRI